MNIGEKSGAIIYKINGIKEENSLMVNEGKTFTLRVEYNSLVTTQPMKVNSSIELNLVYIQNLGSVVNNDTTDSEITKGGNDYEIGDKISFAGSFWYVIEDSPVNQDYVVLLKERVLTNTELGEYAYNNTSDMSYYWDDECHPAAYGYTTRIGCDTHNDYAGSKIKQAVEKYMISYLDVSKLKSVNGYKIRLITTDEIVNNLGWINGVATEATLMVIAFIVGFIIHTIGQCLLALIHLMCMQ